MELFIAICPIKLVYIFYLYCCLNKKLMFKINEILNDDYLKQYKDKIQFLLYKINYGELLKWLLSQQTLAQAMKI